MNDFYNFKKKCKYICFVKELLVVLKLDKLYSDLLIFFKLLFI